MKSLLTFFISLMMAMHFVNHSTLGRVLRLMTYTTSYRNEVISICVLWGIILLLTIILMVCMRLFLRVLMRMFREQPAS